MAGQWDWHDRALAKEKVVISESKVESGFFYSQYKGQKWRVPIVIGRMPDGAFYCRVGTKAKHEIETEEQAAKRWISIAENVVSREDYKVAYETGTWPDNLPTSEPVKTNRSSDPFEALTADIDDKIASAKAWLTAHPVAKTQAEADYARNLQAEILSLNKQADAMHKAEKAPILAQAEAVETKFSFRKIAKGFADSLKGVYEKFAVAEEARQRAEADKKWREEQAKIAAERKKIEDERAKQMADDPIATLTSPDPEMPELPLAPPPVKVQVGGGIGRAAGLKSVWTGEIEDIDAVFQHFKETDQVLEVLQKLVDATVRTNKGATKIPGVKVVEQRKAA